MPLQLFVDSPAHLVVLGVEQVRITGDLKRMGLLLFVLIFSPGITFFFQKVFL